MHVRMITLAAMLAAATPAFAGTFQHYTPQALEAAQQAGKPVIVEVYAPWCPICARQQPTLEKLEADPAYAGIQVLRVDFDDQKPELRKLNVNMQSTLIAYHGATETGRLVGETNKEKIAELFASAVKG